MIQNTIGNKMQNVCDLSYLIEIVAGKKHLIKGIMDSFLIQIPEELNCINDAIIKINYATIKSYSHTMKSSVSIMGISMLVPILKEMEDLGKAAVNIERIKVLNMELNSICKQAMEEIEKVINNYI
jgi:HPt (histidine-containing phosphotransfer) domain-containing protein